MSHGFDVTGRKYDENGNAIRWWSEKMINAYDKKADCFVDQFNEYEVGGKVTEGENIADTAGLNAAFGAYKKQIKKGNRDVRLPGLEDLSGSQLFFVSFATAFCQSATPQFL
ncbi:endothelin-converting enzyme homolog [Belonocnema kinseyi]|uniref:endothelin-converting enzyme homolog n=1 Tax=Belonocnema kinseyi TaxID=2817044 RepID=UPI00143D5506|nr:endothelin-converting enzyme homolog [Belonocnema kinseyi]